MGMGRGSVLLRQSTRVAACEYARSGLRVLSWRLEGTRIHGCGGGIGDYKKDRYGERFVDLICRHLGVARSPEPES